MTNWLDVLKVALVFLIMAFAAKCVAALPNGRVCNDNGGYYND